jgi:hypothetical protein
VFIKYIVVRVLVFIKNYQAQRRGDLHHVSCWIRSSSSGDVLRVIGRLFIWVDSL